jgi:hypothetical protein
MVNNIDIHRIQDLLPKPVGKKGRSQESTDTSSPDAAIDVEFGGLIAAALRFPPADEYAVEQARELIVAGLLDTPENIRAAAAGIVQLGI